MDDEDDDSSLESRPPTLEDLVGLCDALNRASAKYIVVGGMAILQLGFVRATEDVDLLIDGSVENVRRVKEGMASLPDNAAAEVDDRDVQKYTVVRVADEIVVDLMHKACGVDYEQGKADIEMREVNGVPIPFASASLMWKLKQTVREKDKLDRLFLENLLRDKTSKDPGEEA